VENISRFVSCLGFHCHSKCGYLPLIADVFHDPQRAPCGHSFCRGCIEEWLGRNRTCPEDRKPLKKRDLHADFILANIIGDQVK
jgi:E3 ubiquitin-protein ligase NRDP1